MIAVRWLHLRHRGIVMVLAVALLGTSCAAPGVADAVRAASGDESEEGSGHDAGVETGSSVSVYNLDLGDCYNGAFDDTVVMTVDVVPCAEPHDNELYATFEMQGSQFPGDERVVELSVQGCLERFAEFTGIEYGETALEITYFHPTKDSWETFDDREVTCAVYDPAGSVSGTLEGTGGDYAIAFVGDCMDEGWLKVDCAQAHYAEIYLERGLDGDAYPGASAVDSDAAALCEDGFAEFVGAEWADSALNYVYLAPTEEDWSAGYTTVSCAVYDPAGSLTGSVEGSGR